MGGFTTRCIYVYEAALPIMLSSWYGFSLAGQRVLLGQLGSSAVPLCEANFWFETCAGARAALPGDLPTAAEASTRRARAMLPRLNALHET